jgi:hypothetical protein
MELWKVCRAVVSNSHPDPHSSEKPYPDPHLSEKMDELMQIRNLVE